MNWIDTCPYVEVNYMVTHGNLKTLEEKHVFSTALCD